MASVIKEYEHPFFKVELAFDSAKEETDFEKELVARYLHFLDQQQEKSKQMKELRNKYFHEQLMTDEGEPALDKANAQYARLLQLAESFEVESNEDRTAFVDVSDEAAEVYTSYLQFHKEVVDAIRKVIEENEADFNLLYDWFEGEKGSEAYSSLDDYARELYRNYDNYSLDLVAYDKSVDDMKGHWQVLDKEWTELYDLREKTVKQSSRFSNKINETNELVKTVHEKINQLSAGKFKPKEVDVKVLDPACIQFRFEEPDMFSNPADLKNIEVQFRVDFDLDKLEEKLWLFHMDCYVYAHDQMFMQVRTDFRVPLHIRDLVSREVLTQLVDTGFVHAFDCADAYYKKENKKLDWTKFKMPEESREFIISNLVERLAGFDGREEEKMGFYNHAFELEAGLLPQGTMMIINEVLYNNPNFNWEKNQEAFGEHIPMAVYTTIRRIVEKSAEAPQKVNVGKLLPYMLCIECASQLLTGDHLPELEQRLDEKGFKESIRSQYLSASQHFIADVLDQMKKIDSTFVDMEEEFRDWNSIIK